LLIFLQRSFASASFKTTMSWARNFGDQKERPVKAFGCKRNHRPRSKRRLIQGLPSAGGAFEELTPRVQNGRLILPL